PAVTTVGATGPVVPVDAGGAPEVFAGVSTGPCVASMPAAMVGADTTGGVVIGGVACGGGTDPDCIAVIAPSDSECAPAAAGCPVTIPVANDCPIDVGDTPCPRAAGDSDPPGIATGGQWR
ncbi:hypothetical protein, partial [Mycobacterium tuberculosis]